MKAFASAIWSAASKWDRFCLIFLSSLAVANLAAGQYETGFIVALFVVWDVTVLSWKAWGLEWKRRYEELAAERATAAVKDYSVHFVDSDLSENAVEFVKKMRNLNGYGR
ncbi:hypothetical protein IU449_27055 [Nocardia higoensis]|uniref:Uncharacterized protein n=1 Tax=Nocardia higoensis TaxID=228599 RepID=A0ABS0DJ45_9NOCA|nr:hypothetical protein [Nocardia higoensis]MBF6358160.1 hypothetical protein [Nocardia higoensis]